MLSMLLAAPAARADPTAEARALGDRFGAAVASGNVDAVLALYADDARVIYPGHGEEARGKAELKAMLERSLPGMRGLVLVQKSTDAVAVDPTHVMNVGRWEARTVAPNGRRTTATVRTSELLTKENGTWVYLVDHASIGTPPPSAARTRGRHRR